MRVHPNILHVSLVFDEVTTKFVPEPFSVPLYLRGLTLH